tara:strand:+ start:4304 stop:5170 length:867 start_codon:yes stop_codon:yes gene_type:complete
MNNLFVNTIPHSGTHLVTTILDSLGFSHANIKNRFYTVRPYFRRLQKAGINWRSSKELYNYFSIIEKKTVLVSVASPRLVRASLIARLFSEIKDNQYLIGHMPYSDDGKKVIQENIAKTITIIRDPRDMAISMINHSRTRPQHHAHKYLFDELNSESERLNAVLCGYDNHFGSLIGINQMYLSMLKWKEEVENITLKFEDLVGHRGGGNSGNQISSINDLINYLGLVAEFDNEKVSNIAKNSFGVSGTFRKGKIGAWKDFFSRSDKELYKSKIGDLLIDIGYELNKNW